MTNYKPDPPFRQLLTKLIIIKNGFKNMSEFIKISEAKKMRSGVNVDAKVKSKGDPRTVNLKSGNNVDVCDAVITNGDTVDDEMNLTLWGDDIKTVNVGDRVVITNGYTNEFKGVVSLTKGKFGKMDVNPSE